MREYWYTARSITYKKEQNLLEIGIFQYNVHTKEETQIGSYNRNYDSFFDTFYPFIGVDGYDYALYSSDYDSIQLMRLPDCQDILGCPKELVGFCPTGFYVPTYVEYCKYWKEKEKILHIIYDQIDMDFVPEWYRKDTNWWKYNMMSEWYNDNPHNIKFHNFGFVSGCNWGDDSSDKCMILDLSDIPYSIKIVDDLEYFEIPSDQSLSTLINVSSNKNTNLDGIDINIELPRLQYYQRYSDESYFKQIRDEDEEVYVVTMYRFGSYENHSYVVGSYYTLDGAIDAANQENQHRGGGIKYLGEVTKHMIGSKNKEVVWGKIL